MFAVSVISIILNLAFIIVSICASQNFNKRHGVNTGTAGKKTIKIKLHSILNIYPKGHIILQNKKDSISNMGWEENFL